MHGQSCGCSLWQCTMWLVLDLWFPLNCWDSERRFVVQSQDPRTTVRWYMVVEVIDKGGIIPKLFTRTSLAVSWNLGITNFWNVIPSLPPFDKTMNWGSWSQGHGWMPASTISSREGSGTWESRSHASHFHRIFCKDFIYFMLTHFVSSRQTRRFPACRLGQGAEDGGASAIGSRVGGAKCMNVDEAMWHS